MVVCDTGFNALGCNMRVTQAAVCLGVSIWSCVTRVSMHLDVTYGHRACDAACCGLFVCMSPACEYSMNVLGRAHIVGDHGGTR